VLLPKNGSAPPVTAALGTFEPSKVPIMNST